MRVGSVCGIGNKVQRLKKEMNNLHSSFITAATIAAAIGVIGAVSITIYQKFIEQQNPMSNSNLDALNLKVSELQAELEALRAQNQQRKKKKSRKHVSSDSTYTIMDNDTDGDAFSTAGTDAATDIGDDEFFDCSDSEPDNEIRTAERVSQLDSALAAIDECFERKDRSQKEMYEKMKELKELYPDDINIIWRYARAAYDYSTIVQADIAKKIIIEGINVCEENFKESRLTADFHTWYGILLGTLSEISSVSDKIKLGIRYREQIIIALEMRPDDAILRHLLGRFEYELASLSWIEKKVASTLLTALPPGTFEGALENFEKAEELYAEPEIRNRLYLAKTHIALHNYQKAAHWLTKTCELSASTKEEEELMVQAKRLFNKYSSYI